MNPYYVVTLLVVYWPLSFSCSLGHDLTIELTITSPLPVGRVPFQAQVDFGKFLREKVTSEVFDPNSIQIINRVTGERVEFSRTEDFAYGDKGTLEWVITDPSHRTFLIRCRSVAMRPPLELQSYVPPIGVGDLLKFNSSEHQPIALPYSSRLVDLTGDGIVDLVGCWNYAYRPGWPWDGIVCFPGIGPKKSDDHALPLFGDLVRIRYGKSDSNSADRRYDFENIYMWSDFADFDGDGKLDIVWCPANRDQLYFFRNIGTRDPNGFPVFHEAGSVDRPSRQWEACRAIDLDGDSKLDVLIGDQWLRGLTNDVMPPQFAAPRTLDVSGARAWMDVDLDGRTDAIVRREVPGEGLSNYLIAWRRNQGGDEPQFTEPEFLSSINEQVQHPVDAAACKVGQTSWLLITTYPNQTVHGFTQQGPANFRYASAASSPSAVMSLGDQAWPCLCDWDDDGDLDLLVGGGYGWLQLVINLGSRQRLQWSAPKYVEADGQPIRLTRDAILGGENWHDMGYPFPVFADWDADGLPDLVLPNETNRIFWFKNRGTRSVPEFGPRQQIVCDGYLDSDESRLRSAQRAAATNSNNGVYPYEPEQPFFWRTGAAIADWNGDGLTDMVTHDGHTRLATLFVQYRDKSSSLRLKKEQVLKLDDGRPINDSIVQRRSHWTESFRPVDWDRDGLLDLVYSIAGSHGGSLGGSSIYLLKNKGSKHQPVFAAPRPLSCYGQPLRFTNHGPHPWAGDFDGDNLPDLVACVEWSVFPFYSHHAIEQTTAPAYNVRAHNTAP